MRNSDTVLIGDMINELVLVLKEYGDVPIVHGHCDHIDTSSSPVDYIRVGTASDGKTVLVLGLDKRSPVIEVELNEE